MFTDRHEFVEELKLRKLIRKGIRIVHERKKKEAEQVVLEEQKLRKIIRTLIKETATPDNDPAPHKTTGINVLEDLLKNIIPVLEMDYKKLTTDQSQRDSYRAHIVKAVEDALAPPKITDIASGESAEPEEISPLEEVEEEVQLNVGEEKPEESEEFIDIRTNKEKATEEEEEAAQEPDERQEFGVEGQDETGRNVAFASFKKINTAILDSWDVLSDERDKEIFYDYLITNLKLYFDKFENDLGDVQEPTTDEYEEEKEAGHRGEEELETPKGEEEIEL